VIFPESRVNIGKQPIAKFNKLTVNCFVLFAETPRFPLPCVACGMRPHQWCKYSELYPAGKEFAVRLTCKSPDIRSAEGYSRGSQALALNGSQFQVLPGSNVISGPNRRVALHSRISCPGDCERAFIFMKFFKSLVGCPDHLHAINIMCFSV